MRPHGCLPLTIKRPARRVRTSATRAPTASGWTPASRQAGHATRYGDVVPRSTRPTRLTTAGGLHAYDPSPETASDARTSNAGFQGDWTDPDTGQVDMGALVRAVDRRLHLAGQRDTPAATRSWPTATTTAPGALDFDDPTPLAHWLKSVASAVSSTVSSGEQLHSGVSYAGTPVGRR